MAEKRRKRTKNKKKTNWKQKKHSEKPMVPWNTPTIFLLVWIKIYSIKELRESWNVLSWPAVMNDNSGHRDKFESNKKMLVSSTRVRSEWRRLKMKAVMSRLPQPMMTALERHTTQLIFRSDYSLFLCTTLLTFRAQQKRLDTADKTTHLSTYLIGRFGEPYLRRGRSVIQTACQVISTAAVEIRWRVTQPITVITMSHNINARRRQIRLDCCQRLITRGEM